MRHPIAGAVHGPTTLLIYNCAKAGDVSGVCACDALVPMTADEVASVQTATHTWQLLMWIAEGGGDSATHVGLLLGHVCVRLGRLQALMRLLSASASAHHSHAWTHHHVLAVHLLAHELQSMPNICTTSGGNSQPGWQACLLDLTQLMQLAAQHTISGKTSTQDNSIACAMLEATLEVRYRLQRACLSKQDTSCSM
jgi:hypothetical protein